MDPDAAAAAMNSGQPVIDTSWIAETTAAAYSACESGRDRSYRRDRSRSRDRRSSRERGHRRRRSRSSSRDRRRRRSRSRDRRRYSRSPRRRRSRSRSAGRDAPCAKLVITQLPNDIDKEPLTVLFARQGFVPTDIRIIHKTDRGSLRSFGFVDFVDTETARSWMERNQGFLTLGDGRRVAVEYARGETLRYEPDWICAKCTMSNFTKRENCFKCNTPKEESLSLEHRGFGDIGVTSCDTLLIRDLPPMITEARIIDVLRRATADQLPIVQVKLAESMQYAYVQLRNAEEANLLLDTFNKAPLQIDRKDVIVTFSRRPLSVVLSAAIIQEKVSQLSQQMAQPGNYTAAEVAHNALMKAHLMRQMTESAVNAGLAGTPGMHPGGLSHPTTMSIPPPGMQGLPAGSASMMSMPPPNLFPGQPLMTPSPHHPGMMSSGQLPQSPSGMVPNMSLPPPGFSHEMAAVQQQLHLLQQQQHQQHQQLQTGLVPTSSMAAAQPNLTVPPPNMMGGGLQQSGMALAMQPPQHQMVMTSTGLPAGFVPMSSQAMQLQPQQAQVDLQLQLLSQNQAQPHPHQQALQAQSSGLTVPPSSSMVTSLKNGVTGTVKTPLGLMAQYMTPDPSKFVHEPSSGYLHDCVTNFYYDPKTSYYYNTITGKWTYFDETYKTFLPVEEKARIQAAAPTASAATAGAKKEGDQEKKTPAEIAKEMAKWAKKQEKTKVQMSLKPVVKQLETKSAFGGGGGATGSATQDLTFKLLEKSKNPLAMGGEDSDSDEELPPPSAAAPGRGFASSAPSASAGSISRPPEQNPSVPSAAEQREAMERALIDRPAKQCLLCRRAFPTVDVLDKHVEKSDLHRSNLEAKRVEWGKAYVAQMMAASDGRGAENGSIPGPSEPPKTVYRDRAKERRDMHGIDNITASASGMDRYHRSEDQLRRESEFAASAPLDSSNIGNKLLKSMGWQEGLGVGRNLQGIVNPIEAERRVEGAGLGVAGSKLIGGVNASLKDKTRAALYAKFQ